MTDALNFLGWQRYANLYTRGITPKRVTSGGPSLWLSAWVTQKSCSGGEPSRTLSGWGSNQRSPAPIEILLTASPTGWCATILDFLLWQSVKQFLVTSHFCDAFFSDCAQCIKYIAANTVFKPPNQPANVENILLKYGYRINPGQWPRGAKPPQNLF